MVKVKYPEFSFAGSWELLMALWLLDPVCLWICLGCINSCLLLRFKLILIPMSKRNRGGGGGGGFWLFENKESELAEGDQNRLWDPVVDN